MKENKAKQAYHKRKKTESHQETNLQKLSDRNQLELRNEIAEFYSDKPPSFHTKVQYALTKKSVEDISGTRKHSPYEQLWITNSLRIQNTFKRCKYLKPIGEFVHYKNIGPKSAELDEHILHVIEITGCALDLPYETDSRPKSIHILNNAFYQEIADEIKVIPLTVSKYISAFCKSGIMQKIPFKGQGKVSLCIDGYFRNDAGYWRKQPMLNKAKHTKALIDFKL